MSPGRAHLAGRPRRGPAIALVVLVLVGGGLIAHAAGTTPAPTAPPVPAAASTPAGAESSSWYCGGVSGGGTGAVATGSVYLTNTTGRTLSGTIDVVNDTGAEASGPVTIPADTEVGVIPATIEHGSWLATRIDVAGGGVIATQAVTGSQGWSQTPCASATSSHWYFAAGATSGSDQLWVSLFNPTVTPAVVDLTFATGAGVNAPQPFEGIVVPPGHVAVENIAAYVQDQRQVSTTVTTRSGRVVADQLQVSSAGGVNGLSARLGATAPDTAWVLPRSVDEAGGATSLSIFNPTPDPQHVTVSVRLPSGAVAPVTDEVGPDTTWVLNASAVHRIPPNLDYAATVVATSGPGVVVDRTVHAPSSARTPQAGDVGAVPRGVYTAPSRRWWLPGPGSGHTGAVTGAAPSGLAIANPGPRPVVATLSVLTPTGERPLGPQSAVRIAGGGFVVYKQTALAPAGLDPLVITAQGPVAVTEDLAPSGAGASSGWWGSRGTLIRGSGRCRRLEVAAANRAATTPRAPAPAATGAAPAGTGSGAVATGGEARCPAVRGVPTMRAAAGSMRRRRSQVRHLRSRAPALPCRFQRVPRDRARRRQAPRSSRWRPRRSSCRDRAR